MIHELLKVWFGWVEAWGYWGVFVLMAMESSIIPVPSEVVMPPAAFWAAQGKMDFSMVVFMGTAGSYFGSVVNYGLSLWLGKPFIQKYGKYFFLSEEKVLMAEKWVSQFGFFGIFVARLLPVVRHLISIPAGALRMKFIPFSIATTVGAGLWCGLLSWFGQEVIGSNPELLNSPEEMISVIKGKMHWILAAVLLIGILYGIVLRFKKTSQTTSADVTSAGGK